MKPSTDIEIPCNRLSSSRWFLAVRCLALVSGALLVSATQAAPPAPFAVEYEARYGGFKASAIRSLEHLADGEIQMETMLALKLLGKTISRVHEVSSLVTDSDSGTLRPLSYSFDQTGLGSRSRSVVFDWDNAAAVAQSGRDENIIVLDGVAMDNLSAYLALREQLLAGKTEVAFQGIDKGQLEEFHYRVIGEELLKTDAGAFRTVKLERVRDASSHRTTEIWLALDWDYLLIKLVQKEPGSNTISLELTKGAVDGKPVLGSEDA